MYLFLLTFLNLLIQFYNGEWFMSWTVKCDSRYEDMFRGLAACWLVLNNYCIACHHSEPESVILIFWSQKIPIKRYKIPTKYSCTFLSVPVLLFEGDICGNTKKYVNNLEYVSIPQKTEPVWVCRGPGNITVPSPGSARPEVESQDRHSRAHSK